MTTEEAQKAYPILKFFEFSHLPPNLAEIALVFAAVAQTMAEQAPQSAEVVAGLRKLLEAKDCFVRGAL